MTSTHRRNHRSRSFGVTQSSGQVYGGGSVAGHIGTARCSLHAPATWPRDCREVELRWDSGTKSPPTVIGIACSCFAR